MRRGGWLAAGAATVAVVAVTATAIAVWPRHDPPAASGLGPRSSSVTAETGVCGFPGPLISQIVADRPSDAEEAQTRGWDLEVDGGGGQGIAVTADSVIISHEGDDGETVNVRYDHAGTYLGTSSYDFERDRSQPAHTNGAAAVADDGTIWAIDSYEGRRLLTAFSQDGRHSADYPVPASAETTGHPLDLHDVILVDDLEGSPALLVGEGEHTIHAFRQDGTYLGERTGLPDAVQAPFGRTSVAGMSAVPGDEGALSLQVADASTGALLLQVPFRTDGEDAAAGTTPTIQGIRGVAPGPDGDGFLLASATGIEWLDAAGIRRGLWTDGAAGLDLWETGGLAEHDGTYWVLTRGDGVDRVLTLTSDEMRSALTIPSALNASNEPILARLGVGIGAVTHREFDHFDAPDEPAVFLRTETGWGQRQGAPDVSVDVRYTVRGDPLSPSPVLQEERTVEPPIGGGETPLELPEARPGAYEVSLALVDRGSGAILSGSCLRYSVGAEDAPLDLAELPDGADWGGAGPLRGAQLAATLGVGSHRIQLDFSSLVPDPAATPSADGVDWFALPGSDTGEDGVEPTDPEAAGFADIAAAAALARREGVDLVVQVGRSGEGEWAAIDAGTWGGWVGVIAEAFERNAPEITLWSAWNEPNAVFETPSDFATLAEIPFADAVHAANPDAIVLGGNTLGFDPEWWRDSAETGVCSHIDAVAVHPYTGWNRSWEEEGFAADGGGYAELRAALGEDCGRLPIWDTESGWTSDGAAAYWAQGSDVARKLLWYSHERIAGWTYFYSEGGWGENGLSWSLIQDGSYVKPGGLAFASVSRLLADRDPGELVATGIPFAYAMRFSGRTDMVAAWTDEMRVDAVVTADGAAEALTIVDQYGARQTLPLRDGRAEITLAGSPRFILAPAGTTIGIEPVEAFGDDLLEARHVTASSTHVDADPQIVTSGTVNPYRPWRSGRLADGGLDETPTVEVALDAPTTLDRIAVATGNIVCCEAGLRDYTVSVRTADGQWRVVAEQKDQFWDRVVLFSFEPVVATAVRVEVPWTRVRGIRVLDVNFTGFAGGLPPPFMGLQTETDYVATIAAISAWAPAP
ncbi:hypothetical protein [Microbacterium ulmi]|uniref:F5/8 type C domain-containing protein n=1 Tax=Microbacterium ulmi TaxID=179095 RepID=A0A7Y2LYQ6_9MICO|nr:hypothetical protein [Microbacterium ulmi]NII69757.1 hypothetical protein [Microbacterium ulmi]NNH03269.1 hypothetical protein [Microbacterium ulmi]